ncbi:carbon-nitrogen hydrolase family protein [Antrihabitans stalactiti]|uniref:Carbon-nitrogen hydrolase family protein n=1 Tax=Antrihabitans stalactiti TaxID=2584121 RepID=A0A848KMJ4_9NOCA|nr:carbon-nitrogen hydrolase family protein [Antrihabitans stalactiti]NMN99158.1 carbon-nitrogen hydrolase family protein [Antrihabitans stalactiti]
MKQVIRGAAVQAASITLDTAATTDKACELIREAGRNSADVVVFPECFISAYPAWFEFLPAMSPALSDLNVRLLKSAVDVPGPETAKLGEACREAGCYAVVGVVERWQANSGSMFNTQLFFGPDGQLLGKHQKLTPTGYERMVHWGGSGETLTVVDTPWGPLSALACSENSNPLAGFDVVSRGPRVHAMSWPPQFIMSGSGPDLPDVSSLTARHFSILSKAFVISAPGVIDRAFYKEMAEMAGTPDVDLAAGIRDGGAVIVSPGSEIIAGPVAPGVEQIIYADMDLDIWVKMKLLQDFAGHYNRPDVFTLEVNRTPSHYETAK